MDALRSRVVIGVVPGIKPVATKLGRIFDGRSVLPAAFYPAICSYRFRVTKQCSDGTPVPSMDTRIAGSTLLAQDRYEMKSIENGRVSRDLQLPIQSHQIM
jgi:hypothetical protein